MAFLFVTKKLCKKLSRNCLCSAVLRRYPLRSELKVICPTSILFFRSPESMAGVINLPTPWLVLLSPLAPALFVVIGISFRTCSRMASMLATSRGPSFRALKSTGPKAFLSERMVDSANPLLLCPACPVGQKSMVNVSKVIPLSVLTPIFASWNSFIKDDCWSVKCRTAGPTLAAR